MDIWDLTPKKVDCKQCGCTTCGEFARNILYGIKEIDDCPYLSAEAKEKIEKAKLKS